MIELSEDGYIDIGFTVGETRVEKRIDLYEVNNHLYEMRREFQGKPMEVYHAALVEYLVSLGFPACSHRMVVKFEQSINAILDDMTKKDSASEKPDSPSVSAPDSLGPTPAPSTV